MLESDLYYNHKGSKRAETRGKMLNNIEAERVRNRLTKEELAKKLGVSMRTYCNWIKEDTDILGVALIRLGRMFGTDVDYLMQGCMGVEEKEVV